MKKLPIGIQTFSEIIEKNYVYVDKTAQIYEIVSTGQYYFFSRPRRFGKSLLVSTLAELFSGNRDLFRGLVIDSLSWDWKQHSVIQVSFASIAYETPDSLKNGIKLRLQDIAKASHISLPEITSTDPGRMLQVLTKELYEKTSQQVVLLIDEYDYAILRHVHNPPVADQIREVLMGFYGVIKDLDPYLRFVFLTGVSKFSKTAIFSGLNNLQDLTLDERAASLLGYTQQEIVVSFPEYLELANKKLQVSSEQLIAMIRDWYDGYSFTREPRESKNEMYNPFSVLNFLQKKDFSNYWFESGTPTFLINLIKKNDYPVQDFENTEATDAELGTFDIHNISLKTLLFQTGYLTIDHYIAADRYYVLRYPNKEVIYSLTEYIFASITNGEKIYLIKVVSALKKSLDTKNSEQLLEALSRLYALVPYTLHIGEEKYYQTIFYLILKLAGADIIVEEATNIGRIDAVLETAKEIFIIEFKINTTAKKAIQQIVDRNYAQKYQGQGKRITAVGIAFDMTLKNVAEVEVITLPD